MKTHGRVKWYVDNEISIITKFVETFEKFEKICVPQTRVYQHYYYTLPSLHSFETNKTGY